MHKEKNLKGYPSIDKPWLKYYENSKIEMKLPECSIYEYLLQNNQGHYDDIAIDFMGHQISYGTLFQQIETASAGLADLGVKNGDIVSFITITTPEIISTIYAVNKLGAVCNMIDPRAAVETIMSIISRTKSRHLVVLDIFASMIPDSITHNCQVIIMPSQPIENEFAFPHKKWCELIQSSTTVPGSVFNSNMPALIEYTGGTTGEPKGIVLSNENINSAAFQYSRTRIPNTRGETWQAVSAPFIAYVFIFSMHIPLSLGMVCKLVIYDPKTIAIQTVQEKFNHICGNPLMWENVIHLPEAQNQDFSHIIAPITGADYMSPKLETEINTFLKSHGCQWSICQRYGLTETAAGVCTNQGDGCNRLGSVGIPFIDTSISIYDSETNEELSYDEVGEVCISGPSIMLGYFGNENATNDMIRIHNDGTRWLHTGDLGHMDSDGFLYIDGRIKRMFVAYNGAKIFPPIIEKVILQSDKISGCVVVGKQDPDHAVGQIAVAYIILKDSLCKNKSAVIEDLISLCKENLPEYEHPHEWFFVESFPRTPVGKVDYRALEETSQ